MTTTSRTCTGLRQQTWKRRRPSLFLVSNQGLSKYAPNGKSYLACGCQTNQFNSIRIIDDEITTNVKNFPAGVKLTEFGKRNSPLIGASPKAAPTNLVTPSSSFTIPLNSFQAIPNPFPNMDLVHCYVTNHSVEHAQVCANKPGRNAVVLLYYSSQFISGFS